MSGEPRKRLLIFVVAYNAEKTIQSVLARIPASLGDAYEVQVLAIDDASRDRTFEKGYRVKVEGALPYPLHVLFNPENQGYGGNQKIGYHYAIENGFDFVALIHGDGQYAPEALPGMLEPLREATADAVFGSRMMTRGAAREGGMPLYKYVGNKILTWFENRMLRSSLSEFHSGYRIYSVAALRKIPFDRNTNDFHFDTEIIVQFMVAGLRIRELPIPTYYGNEICHVNGLKYAWDVFKAVLKARAQELGIFYEPKFDCAPAGNGNAQYQIKLGYESPHTAALERVPQGARVLDLGCAGGYMGEVLRRERGCHVTGVDMFPLGPGVQLAQFLEHNLDAGPPPVAFEDYDLVLILDVFEHLAAPEAFVDGLREAMKHCGHARLIVSTGNVGFIVVRLMLLLGQFNYGKRGILDLTHKRLFTFASLRQLFEEAGFEVLDTRGIPAPFPLALGDGALGRAMVSVNGVLVKLLRGLFAYQIFMVVEPRPTLERLLERAVHESAARAATVDASASDRGAQRVA